MWRGGIGTCSEVQKCDFWVPTVAHLEITVFMHPKVFTDAWKVLSAMRFTSRRSDHSPASLRLDVAVGGSPSRLICLLMHESPVAEPDATISAWAAGKNLEAAVWTNLPPKFDGIDGRVPTENEVVAYLRMLEGKERVAA